MNNKHKTHRLHRFSVSEPRLCRMVRPFGAAPDYDPDASTGKPHSAPLLIVQNSNEQQRPYWETIDYALNAAVNKRGSKELKEIWSRPELRQWIMAQVERNPIDGRLTWLPPNGRQHAEEFQRIEDTREKELVLINLKVSQAVDAYIDRLDSALDVLQAKDLPEVGGVDWDVLKEILQKRVDERKNFIKRQHALVTLIRDIVFRGEKPEQLKKQLEVTLNYHIEQGVFDEDFAKRIRDEVFIILDKEPPALFADKKKKMLDTLEKIGIIGLSVDDSNALKAAIAKLTTAIADRTEAEEKIIEKVFADQTRYLRSITGDDQEAIIRTGIREDFKFSTERFYQHIEVLLKRKLDPAEKTKLEELLAEDKIEADTDKATALETKYGLNKSDIEKILKHLLKNGSADIANGTYADIKLIETVKATVGVGFDLKEFLKGVADSWKANNETKLFQYLRDDLHLDDQVGYSIKRMMLRARMPTSVSKFLIDSDMDIRVSDLIAISGIDKTKFVAGVISVETAKQVIELISVTNEGSGQTTIEKKRFIDVMAFILLNNGGANEKAAVTTAREDAESAWKDLLNATPQLVVGDADDTEFVLPDKNKLSTQLQTLTMGTRAVAFQEKMHDKGLHELTWAESSKKYIHQFIDDATVGGGSWLEYMKDLTAIVYTSSDGRMSDIMENETRLRKLRAALQDALDADQRTKKGSSEMITRARKKVQELHTEITRLSKPLKATAKIGESVLQALYLLEANTHVINTLRAGNLWDEIPNSIRQTSLWIAMNKGGSSAAGIYEAQAFLRAYHSAPRALKYYDDAFNRYFGAGADAAGQTSDNFKQYVTSVGVYQSISKIDNGVYTTYIDAIGKYHDALYLTPDTLVGRSIKAAKADGTVVFGTVTEVIDKTDLTNVTVKVDTGAGVVKATFNFEEYKKAFVIGSRKLHDEAAAAYRAASATYEATKDKRDPANTAYNEFLEAYMRGEVAGLAPITKEERKHLLRYRRKIEVVIEIEGRDNLSAMFHRHNLYVKPAAVMALAESKTNPQVAGATFPEVSLTNGSYSVDRWLAEGHREFADEPLRIIIGGPPLARDALIQAFIEKRDVEYPTGKIGADGKPEMAVITAQEAFMHVSEIQRLIQWQSEQHHPALEELAEDELFKDPIEGGFRAMVETMQDMWAGDMVDKAKVIGAIVAAVWLVRHILKKGGEDGAGIFMKMAKLAIIGLPLLMVANSAYKSRTGRDILGEKLLYMSKSKRNGILEQWRRRSAKYDLERYGILMHPAGFAAMQELMRKNNPVPIKDLHQWRMSVKDNGTGYNNYLNGIPAGINLSQIQMHLGNNASKEEAAKVAYMTYEALCVDVAAMHNKTSGNIQTRANWGADYIFREYHLAESYAGVASGPGKDAPTLQDKIRGRNPGMLDIMLAEALLPSIKNSVQSERTVVEWLVDATGYSAEFIQTKLVQGYTAAELLVYKGVEAAPDIWEGAKEWTYDTYEDAAAWLKVRWKFTSEIVARNFFACITAIREAGVVVMETTPGVIEFVFDGTVNITSSVLNKMKEAHDYILQHEGVFGEIRLIKKFEEFVLSTFGYDFLQELNAKEAETQIKTNITQLVSFLDGGIYSPIDGKGKYTYSRSYPGERTPSLRFGSTTVAGRFEDLSFNDAQDKITKLLNELAGTIYSASFPGGTAPDYTKLPVAQQRYLLELLKGNLFRNIANHPGAIVNSAKYNQELETKKDELKQASDALRALSPDVGLKVIELNEAVEEIEILMTSEPAAIERALDRKGKELGRELTRLSTITGQLFAVVLEIQAGITNNMNPVEMFLLNTKKRALTALKTSTKARVDASLARVQQLHVFHVMSQELAVADRTNRAAYGNAVITNALDKQHNAIVTITVNGQPKQINLGAQDAKDIRDEASISLKKYNTIKATLTGMKADQKRLAEKISTLFSEIRGLERQGVDPVLIEEADLFKDAGTEVETLAQNKNARSQAILTKVYNEPWGLVGVSLEKLFGEAGKVAAERVESWIQRRLSNDQVLKKYAASGKDPAAVAAYPRYLAHIGLSETFMRAMIRGAGINEKVSPLHLSYDEAQAMDKYLEETERMVSFAQFLEIWEPFSDDERNKYLP